MKKQYLIPTVEVVFAEKLDIITMSGKDDVANDIFGGSIVFFK